jgi:hypothetical protein
VTLLAFSYFAIFIWKDVKAPSFNLWSRLIEFILFFFFAPPTSLRIQWIRSVDFIQTFISLLIRMSIFSLSSLHEVPPTLSLRTAAPCIVLPLEECILSVDTSSHSSSPLDVTIEASNIFPSTTHFPSSPPSILTLPAVERGISSESHHSNGPYERANWSSSLLSPPPPSYLQLPNCPICLRRIVSRLSHVNEETLDERDRLIIGPSFIGHGDRCLVCHIYSDTSSTVGFLILFLFDQLFELSCSSGFVMFVACVRMFGHVCSAGTRAAVDTPLSMPRNISMTKVQIRLNLNL